MKIEDTYTSFGLESSGDWTGLTLVHNGSERLLWINAVGQVRCNGEYYLPPPRDRDDLVRLVVHYCWHVIYPTEFGWPRPVPKERMDPRLVLNPGIADAVVEALASWTK